MARCEDFPCCGHELGCCPDYDESGRQTNMICVCGAVLPVNAPYSICRWCMNSSSEGGYEPRGKGDEYDDDLSDEERAEYEPDHFRDNVDQEENDAFWDEQ